MEDGSSDTDSESSDDFPLAGPPIYDSLTPIKTNRNLTEQLKASQSKIPRFLFRATSWNSSMMVLNTAKIRSKGSMAGIALPHSDLLEAPEETTGEILKGHLQWNEEITCSPFISWTYSPLFAVLRAIPGWEYNTTQDQSDIWICVLDLSALTEYARGQFWKVDEGMLKYLCLYTTEELKIVEETQLHETEVVSYGSFGCQGALQIARWSRLEQILTPLCPPLAEQRNKSAAQLNSNVTRARREIRIARSRSYISLDQFDEAIKAAKIFLMADEYGEKIVMDPHPAIVAAILCLVPAKITERAKARLTALVTSPSQVVDCFPGKSGDLSIHVDDANDFKHLMTDLRRGGR